jgi:hypothetical protein
MLNVEYRMNGNDKKGQPYTGLALISTFDIPYSKFNILMQPFLLLHQLLHSFLVHFVGNTAIDRANSRALRFFMKTLAFRALAWRDVISVVGYGRIALTRINNSTVNEYISSFYAGAFGDCPFHATFINSIVWALGLAGTAVDTFIGYLNGHKVGLGLSITFVRQK